MTTRYQKSHYEDVAEILRHERDAGLSGLGSNMGSTAIACVMLEFADLFAADNPHLCADCNVRQGEEPTSGRCFEARNRRSHLFVGGFDRERFLTACGLESEG